MVFRHRGADLDLPVCRSDFMRAHRSMVHLRMDDESKANAIEVLATIGLSVSDTVPPFLRRFVGDQASSSRRSA